MLFSSHVRKVGTWPGGHGGQSLEGLRRETRDSLGPGLVASDTLDTTILGQPVRKEHREGGIVGSGGGWAVPAWAQAALLQVNRFRKSRDRALLLTDRHLYKLEPGRQYRVMRAVPLDAVSTVAMLHHLCVSVRALGAFTSPLHGLLLIDNADHP